MKNLRTHGKSTIVWLLMALMVLGLGGYGVTTFSSGTANIGAVGKTEIDAQDYARLLQQEVNGMSQQAGRQITMAQAQAMGLPQAVQARLFTAATLGEEARRIGLSVGDARVASAITEAASFQGPTGQFDRNTYAQILRREGMQESEFEQDVREDEARVILQQAITGGVPAPRAMVDATSAWLLESRDLTWRELTPDALAQPVSDPDDATLEGWHQANADRFTAPEIRKITYAWVTPEMLAPEVELDEAALRDLYDSRAAEFQQPERRMVERLVFQDRAAADAAKARIDAGEAPFAAIVAERGLTLEDIDLGEVTEADLGAAGAPVFALEGPGVAGPIDTALGPALFSMNAILEPVNVSFEEALPDLRAEAAQDRARRVIEDRASEFEDLLASGASIEDLAAETPMEMGQIDWFADSQPEPGSIAGYESFRERAATLASDDFPQLESLADGGVYVARLDEIVPPTLTPFDEVRDAVAADWRMAEQHRLLLALADDQKLTLMAADADQPAPEPATGTEAGTDAEPATDAAPAAPAEAGPEPASEAESAGTEAATAPSAIAAGTPVTGLTRDGWIDGLPPAILTRAFEIESAGETEIVDADGRVFLVTLDAIHPADLAQDDADPVLDATANRLEQSFQSDLFEYYARAAQQRAGVSLNQTVIDGVNAGMP